MILHSGVPNLVIAADEDLQVLGGLLWLAGLVGLDEAFRELGDTRSTEHLHHFTVDLFRLATIGGVGNGPMDKLKENLFTLSVVGVVVLLLALAYFLVVSPLMVLSGAEAQLETATRQLQNHNKKEFVETEEYVGYLERVRNTEDVDLTDGVGFYEDKMRRFEVFFDQTTIVPTPAWWRRPAP